jgi:hypothetical protein
VSVATVIDKTAIFFGGPYDPLTHTYHQSPPVLAGVGTVRRAHPKVEDFNEFTAGALGVATGAVIVVDAEGVDDGPRAALPAVQGRRLVRYAVCLQCFMWSTAAYAEDCVDFRHALYDTIIAKIRTDPTLGTGGFEAGYFQVGEGEGSLGVISTEMTQGNTEDGATKAYMGIHFTATAYEVG